nr:MAG TPA: hypothetical protein [Caudoviricetes sp.]
MLDSYRVCVRIVESLCQIPYLKFFRPPEGPKSRLYYVY